MKFEMEESDLC